jgi:hypothetical protein
MAGRQPSDSGHDSVATETAVTTATATAIHDRRVTMSATPNRAQPGSGPKPDSLRFLRAGAIWTGLPRREQHLLLWLLGGDIVTAELASLLVYGQLRTAQRRLSRLVDLGLLRGFWSAGAHRPRGRYAYVLTKAARVDVERLAWPDGRPARKAELPASAPIHQLATLDLFAAFVRHGDTLLEEGIFAWIPERACGQLFGPFVRPDALAGVRVGDRAIGLFIERDLGTERGEVLAEKIRRYRSAFAKVAEVPLYVGFVVDSPRRAATIHELIRGSNTTDQGPLIVTAIDEHLRADPLGASWSDGRSKLATRYLAAIAMGVTRPVIAPQCLQDATALASLDDRALAMFPGMPASSH